MSHSITRCMQQHSRSARSPGCLAACVTEQRSSKWVAGRQRLAMGMNRDVFSSHCRRLNQCLGLHVGAQQQPKAEVEKATIKAALSPEHVALNVDLPPDEVPFTELHGVSLLFPAPWQWECTARNRALPQGLTILPRGTAPSFSLHCHEYMWPHEYQRHQTAHGHRATTWDSPAA